MTPISNSLAPGLTQADVDEVFKPQEAKSNETKMVTFDKADVIGQCQKLIRTAAPGSTPVVVLPIQEPVGTKKNMAYLDNSNRKSPRGSVVKDDAFAAMFYQPYACAKFNAFEVASYLTMQMILEASE